MSPTPMLNLHHLNNSRSQRILWMLEELSLDYQITQHQRDTKTMLAPNALKQIHPLGKAPILVHDDKAIAESGAIIDYLADNFGRDEWKPTVGSDAYLQYQYWLHFAEGSAMPPMLLSLVFRRMLERAKPFFVKAIIKKVVEKVNSAFIRPNLENNFRFINDHLAEHTWFAGEAISGADIQMSFILEAAMARGLVSQTEHPAIAGFVATIQERPAYQRAIEKGGQYDFV